MSVFRALLFIGVLFGSAVSAATLTATRSVPSSPANLSDLGTDDFAHWGLVDQTSFDHKAGANLISNLTPLLGNGGLFYQIANDSVFYSWSGGTPTATASNTNSLVYIHYGGVGAGFTFTAPADTTNRTLYVWLGCYNDTARLDLSLSDSSAPPVADSSFTATNQTSALYTIQYTAASAAQTLTVKWTVVNGTGNPTIQSAALSSTNIGPKIHVACVGDSITAGAGASNIATTSYPAVLQGLLGSNYQVGNFGHSGATMLSQGDLPYVGTAEYTSSNSFNADIVVLMLGSNDTKSWNWQYSSQFSPDTIAMINHYAGLATHPQVYLCTICPAIPPGAYGITEPIVLQVLPVLQQCATDTLTPLINVHAVMSTVPTSDFPDNVHPNDAGYSILAQTVYDAIRMAKPDTLVLFPISTTQIDLFWLNHATNATQVVIERKQGAAGTYASVGTVAATENIFHDTGLTAATAYYYRVRATNTAGQTPYSNEAAATTKAPNSPPVQTSAPVFTPNPPCAGFPVGIVVPSDDVDGDTVITTINWGDGTTDTSGQHTYATAGPFTVNISLSDGTASTTVQPFQLTLSAPPPYTLSKLSCMFKLTVNGSDSWQLSGILPNLPAHQVFLQKHLTVNVGGAVAQFVLDAKGKAKAPSSSFAFKLKFAKDSSGKPYFIGGNAPFTAKFKGAFAAVLEQAGVVDPNSDFKKQPLAVLTSIVFDRQPYVVIAQTKLTSKAHKGGSFKQ